MFLIELPIILLGLVVSGYLLWTYPAASGLIMSAFAVLWDVMQFGTTAETASHGSGISLYPPDLACIVLAAACMVVCLRTRSLPRDFCRPAALLFGMCLLNLARGALVFGLKPAGNFSRATIDLVLPMVAISALVQTFG